MWDGTVRPCVYTNYFRLLKIARNKEKTPNANVTVARTHLDEAVCSGTLMIGTRENSPFPGRWPCQS